MSALNGLRGLAAVCVVVSHGANMGMLPLVLASGLGRVSVAVFYALSGFLMAHICFRQEFGRRSLYRYAVARGTRVLPMFYVVVTVNTAGLLLLGRAYFDFHGLRDVASNLLLVRGTDVLWSVPVEIQFYLLFVGIWWSHRKGRLLPAMAAMEAVCVALAFNLYHYVPNRDLLPFWFHFFLIGVTVRWLLDTGARNIVPWHRLPGWMRLASWPCFALLALFPPELRWSLGEPRLAYVIDPLVLGLLPPMLLYCAAGTGPFRLLAGPIPSWFGKISFSLYLLHMPIMQAISDHEIFAGLGPLVQFAIAFAAASAAAAASFALVEWPLQAGLRKKLGIDKSAAAPQAAASAPGAAA